MTKKQMLFGSNDLPIHFFTIVLNGEPFIRYHERMLSTLPMHWHWHIIEGVAALKHDTAWSVASGGHIPDDIHYRGRSIDGTSQYLDDLALRYPKSVTIYRKPLDEFWDGKREMVNAPLSRITEPCLLWQMDSDELWTSEQVTRVHQAFVRTHKRTAALYWCWYFVGPNKVVSTRDNYGNPRQDAWLRTWRFEPNDSWRHHEPPQLIRRLGRTEVDVAKIAPFEHDEMESIGAVFQHFAYVMEEQLAFKEKYYGYRNAVAQWRELQHHIGPGLLRHYLKWVPDDAKFDDVHSLGVEPIAKIDQQSQRWVFSDAGSIKAGDSGDVGKHFDGAKFPKVSMNIRWRFLNTLIASASYFSTLGRTYLAARKLPAGHERTEAIRQVRDLIASGVRSLLRSPRENRIAIVRLDNIGDLVLWLDCARAIRSRYPRPVYQLIMVAPTIWGDFAFASGLFDEVFLIDRDRYWRDRRYRKDVYRSVAAKRFGSVINPVFSRAFTGDDSLSLATRAIDRIGSSGDTSNMLQSLKDISDRWYTQLIPIPADRQHELERNWAIEQYFNPSMQQKFPRLSTAMIQRPHWLKPSEPYFVSFVGASWHGRVWPVEAQAEIVRRIHRHTGWRGIICGATTDSHLAEQLLAHVPTLPVESAVGRTSIAELAGVIEASELVVTNETSSVHLASATGTPAICIVGGGHFGRFVPYPRIGDSPSPIVSVAHQMPCFGCNWRCVYPVQPGQAVPCVAQVSVEAVWNAVEAVITRRSHS